MEKKLQKYRRQISILVKHTKDVNLLRWISELLKAQIEHERRFKK